MLGSCVCHYHALASKQLIKTQWYLENTTEMVMAIVQLLQCAIICCSTAEWVHSTPTPRHLYSEIALPSQKLFKSSIQHLLRYSLSTSVWTLVTFDSLFSRLSPCRQGRRQRMLSITPPASKEWSREWKKKKNKDKMICKPTQLRIVWDEPCRIFVNFPSGIKDYATWQREKVDNASF